MLAIENRALIADAKLKTATVLFCNSTVQSACAISLHSSFESEVRILNSVKTQSIYQKN